MEEKKIPLTEKEIEAIPEWKNLFTGDDIIEIKNSERLYSSLMDGKRRCEEIVSILDREMRDVQGLINQVIKKYKPSDNKKSSATGKSSDDTGQRREISAVSLCQKLAGEIQQGNDMDVVLERDFSEFPEKVKKIIKCLSLQKQKLLELKNVLIDECFKKLENASEPIVTVFKTEFEKYGRCETDAKLLKSLMTVLRTDLEKLVENNFCDFSEEERLELIDYLRKDMKDLICTDYPAFQQRFTELWDAKPGNDCEKEDFIELLDHYVKERNIKKSDLGVRSQSAWNRMRKDYTNQNYRDDIIVVCFGLKLSLPEANLLMNASLQPFIPLSGSRDSIICRRLERLYYDIDDLNRTLIEHRMEPLRWDGNT